MDTSDTTANAPIPVENGTTWTLTTNYLARSAEADGHSVLAVSNHSDDATLSTQPMSVIIDVDRESVRPAPGSGPGWTSIVIESHVGQWMNIVVYDPAPLIDALSEAQLRQQHHDDVHDPRELLATPVGNSGATYIDLIRAAAKLPDSSSHSASIQALNDVVSIWELFFARHPHLIASENEERAMVFYADDMTTYSLLEAARFLPEVSNSAEPSLTDVRLANTLGRLRSLTNSIAPGYDIDKRCNDAIEAHTDLVPGAASCYRG